MSENKKELKFNSDFDSFMFLLSDVVSDVDTFYVMLGEFKRNIEKKSDSINVFNLEAMKNQIKGILSTKRYRKVDKEKLNTFLDAIELKEVVKNG